MAYSFKRKDTSVEHGLKRIAAGQLNAGLKELEGSALSPEEKIHQARKRCKKMRALVRFVRESFDGYALENEAYRDVARRLSGVRDTAAGLEVLDKLETRFASDLKAGALAPLRKALQAGHVERPAAEIEGLLDETRASFHDGLQRSKAWTLRDKGADAFAPSAARSYKQARKAMKAARRHRIAAAFHEWRKGAKYHWYHARLIKPVWPEVMSGFVHEASKLGEDLGEHHDLAVLKDRTDELLAKTEPAARELLQALASTRQRELETRAFRCGARLFAEDPDALAIRWARWWQAWRD